MNANQTPLPVDPDAVTEFWWQMVKAGHTHEVRIPKVRRNGPNRLWNVTSGFFDHPDQLVESIDVLNGYDAEGIYLTLNPVHRDLFSRAANRLSRDAKIEAAKDENITELRNMLIDVDPERPTGISSTDDERAAALSVRDTIADYLTSIVGWPPPVATLMTGNGGGLIYRISLPNDQASRSLIERVLKGLNYLFEIVGVAKVDTSTYNASRLVKIAGTIAAKGDDTPERPWRRATAVYGTAMPVFADLLEAVAAYAVAEPVQRNTTRSNPNVSSSRAIADEIPDLLGRAGVGYQVKQRDKFTIYELDRCLTSNDHDDAACIMAFPSGAVEYRCLHARCSTKRWADVRDQLGVVSSPRTILTVGGSSARLTAVSPAESPSAPANATDYSFTVNPLPAACLTGWLGEYVALMDPLSEAPTTFHLASGFALAGASIGRKICNRYVSKNLYANQYIMLVGLAGTSKKDTAIRFAIELPTHVVPGQMTFTKPEFEIAMDVGSAEGLINTLKEKPNTFLWITEFQRLIRNARRSSTSTIFPLMTAAWDTPVRLENNVKGNPLEARFPFLTTMAAVQPGILANEFMQEDIQSGFATRWLYVVGSSDRVLPDPPDIDPDKASALYRELKRKIDGYGTRDGSEYRLYLSEQARVRWLEWYDFDHHRSDGNPDEDEHSMRSRLSVHIRKLALMYAVCDGVREIDLHHLEPAIAFGEWCWSHTRQLMKQWGVSLWKDVELKIEQTLITHSPIRRRDLQRLCSNRRWTGVEFGKVLEAMIKNETVNVTEDGALAWSG